MKKLIIILLISFIFCSCKEEIQFENIHELIERVKIENKLSKYPELNVDSNTINYKYVKNSMKLKSDSIAYYHYYKKGEPITKDRVSMESGTLRVVTIMPEIENSNISDTYFELNSKQITFEEFKKIDVRTLSRKNVFNKKEKIQKIFPNLIKYSTIIILNTDKFIELNQR